MKKEENAKNKIIWTAFTFDLTALTYIYLSCMFDGLMCNFMQLYLLSAASTFNYFFKVWRNRIAKKEKFIIMDELKDVWLEGH